MKIKLRVETDLWKDGGQIFDVIKDLEQHLGKHIPHERMVMRNFFVGEGWAIDHCVDHWELRISARTARKPWVTMFLLRWT